MFCPICRRVRPRFTMVDKAAGKDWEKLPLEYICIRCRCDDAGKLDYLMGTDRLRQVIAIAPDKAAYCIFTQFRGPENAIKLISVRTKTQ